MKIVSCETNRSPFTRLIICGYWLFQTVLLLFKEIVGLCQRFRKISYKLKARLSEVAFVAEPLQNLGILYEDK